MFSTFKVNCSSVHTCHKQDRSTCAASTGVLGPKKAKVDVKNKTQKNKSVVPCFTQILFYDIKTCKFKKRILA